MINDGKYIKNAKGGYDLLEHVKPVDLLRDNLVKDIAARTEKMAEAVSALKESFVNDIKEFVNLSAEEYGTKLGGKKGNVTLTSYDGEYRVIFAIDDYLTFDERLAVAKQLIDECIDDWAQGTRSEIRTLINDAFYVGKSGKINTARILGLRRLQIDDPKWRRAMDAISDSILITTSKEYIRVYKRSPQGDYIHINLNPVK